GTIDIQDQAGCGILFSNGTLDNFGTLTITDNANLFDAGNTNSVHNEPGATINGTGPGTGTPATLNVPLDNDGTITATSATLNVRAAQPPGSFETGTFTAAPGGTVRLHDLELFGTPTIGAPPGGTVSINSVTSNAGSGATVPTGRTLDWEV